MDATALLRELETFTFPHTPSSEELHAVVSFLYPIFLKPSPKETPFTAEHLCYFKAKEIFEQILFDRVADSRNTIKNQVLGNSILEKNVSFAKNFISDVAAEKAVSNEEILEKIYSELGYPEFIYIPWNTTEAYQALSPYFAWIESEMRHDTTAHLRIFWNVMKYAQVPIKNAFFQWGTELVKKQLVEVDFNTHMSLALQMSYLPIERPTTKKDDFYKWIDYLDHCNPVVRAAAASCIGATYVDWETVQNEFLGSKHISLPDMLDLIYQKQVAGRNVAGGFVYGCCVDGTFRELETHTLLTKVSFNVKEWVLKTAIDSPTYEPVIPVAQPFWFYVHEYFANDPAAVHQLIEGKRYWLAMMCAIEDLQYTKEKMQPVLDRLLAEAPEPIAAEVAKQLALVT